MRSARFDMALRGDASLQGASAIVVFGPQAEDDLSPLPRDAVTVVSGFKPDYDHFSRQGFAVVADAADAPLADLALVCLPRSKHAARDMLARAAGGLRAGGRLMLDGQKTDGIVAVLKDLSDLGADLGEVISKAHGKLAVFTPPARLIEWAGAPQEIEGGFITRAGVFSADGPDRASQLLAEILPAKLPARVADFGAGWGYLSRAILARDGVRSLDLIEADAAALACARQNIADSRASFHWADVADVRPTLPWEAVVMNPPFHTTRSANPALGLAFLTAAHARLAGHGQLWVVANRQLPYPAALKGMFRDVEEFGRDPTFRLIRAAFPIRAR
jgi:16S rRNA (guanine1207-N2)-methyltransferase